MSDTIAMSPFSVVYRGYRIEDSWSVFCRIYKDNKLVHEFQKAGDWQESYNQACEWVERQV